MISDAPSVPFQLGEALSYAGLTVVPLVAETEPSAEFVSLDEALAAGLLIDEIDEAGAVESLQVTNQLDRSVLLYEGEQLVGAKQNRVLDRPVLLPEHAVVDVPVLCVERGRWSYRSRRFKSPPHAAYPTLRHAGHSLGQAGVWRDVRAKSRRLGVTSNTEAAEVMYTSSRRKLGGYLAAFPCQAGQCGSIVAVASKFICLDFISRPDVHACIYEKLLRGYALDAIDAASGDTDPGDGAEAFLLEVASAEHRPVQTHGSGDLNRLVSSRVFGWELRLGEEVIALTALAA